MGKVFFMPVGGKVQPDESCAPVRYAGNNDWYSESPRMSALRSAHSVNPG